MGLQKLTQSIIDSIGGRRIVIYTMVKSYLKQMAEQFGDVVLARIELIIDDVERNFGTCEVDDTHQYKVVPVDYLQNLDPNEYVILITSEYYWKKKENLDNLPYPITKDVYYFEDIDTAYYHEYLDEYKATPLRDAIVFRSGMRVAADYPYSDFTDNAKALFDYMLEKGYNERYELIWIVADPTKCNDYNSIPNVRFLDDEWCHSKKKNERDAYYEAICLSKYFFFTEHCSFVRLPREGQVRIQLWHGHGFKGRNIYEDCSFQYDYMTVAGNLYKQIHKEIFRLKEEQLLITGLPKQDWVYHPVSPREWESLGIPRAEKYIFWLPTVRKTGRGSITDNDTLHTETGLSVVNSYSDLDKLNALLERFRMVLVVKLHPEQEENINFNGKYRNIHILKNQLLADRRIHINQLFAYSDALVSDYSSVAMDYALTDKPIAFMLEDKEAYEKSIGFVLNPIEEYLPGVCVYSYDEFESFIKEVYEGNDGCADRRRRMSRLMNEFQDDKNCERVLEAVGIK
ncbi:MAG: CDP-glycerol glycerophosphotransferase family protein [Lachnospiraceae bacterium]|nr:CDP-glycerol glycerophosphotransferase family protein [Lachnospiraceae bacterium]